MNPRNKNTSSEVYGYDIHDRVEDNGFDERYNEAYRINITNYFLD
jgi:hypothetical protein